jgi:hypothetical protein
VYISINTKLIFKVPYQVGTSDISLSKQSTSSGAGSSGGCSYEVLHSQARKIHFTVYSFFKKYKPEDERSRLNFSKCQVLIAKAYGVHKSSVSWICRDTKKSSTQEDPVFVLLRKKINMQKKKSDKPRQLP